MFFFQIKKAVFGIQFDLNELSSETQRLVESIQNFVQSDLHTLSQESARLVSRFRELAERTNDKTSSLDSLLKSVSSLTSILYPSVGKEVASRKSEGIPSAVKWIASSIFLFKKAREFVKK